MMAKGLHVKSTFNNLVMDIAPHLNMSCFILQRTHIFDRYAIKETSYMEDVEF
jgi:hypothetical protein